MTDPMKVQAIMKMVRPKSAAELKSFVGAAGWMRRWIPSFAARHDETSPPVKTKSTLSDEEDETEYEIDQILAVRVQRGEYEYLVSWKGYSARLSSSWLDEAGLTPNAAEILAEFKAKVEMPPLPKKRRRR